jgi:hypothetical protein
MIAAPFLSFFFEAVNHQLVYLFFLHYCTQILLPVFIPLSDWPNQDTSQDDEEDKIDIKFQNLFLHKSRLHKSRLRSERLIIYGFYGRFSDRLIVSNGW